MWRVTSTGVRVIFPERQDVSREQKCKRHRYQSRVELHLSKVAHVGGELLYVCSTKSKVSEQTGRHATSGFFCVYALHEHSVEAYSANEEDDDRMNSWTSAGCVKQVLRHLGTEGLFASCTGACKCCMIPMDDFMWYFMQSIVPKRSFTKCCCTYCGAASEHGVGSCNGTMQHGYDLGSCVVFRRIAHRRDAVGWWVP